MADPSLPDIMGASDRFWTQLRRERRGDENVGHVADLKECNLAVWFRRNGFEKASEPASVYRMFQLGHSAEDVEARALAEGLKADGWTLERGVLYWLGHVSIERTGPAAELEVQQHDEGTGLIGGRLPEVYRGCIGCRDNDTDHDHFTGRCRASFHDGACTCEAYAPKTALLGDTVLVGHGDYTIRKAWASVVIDAKSKGYVSSKDAANPRHDYVTQNRAYAFAEGARMFGPLQIGRDNGSLTHQWIRTHEPAELAKLAALVIDRLQQTRAGAPQPTAQPPHEWSCKAGKDGRPYCGWTLCQRNPAYAPERGLQLDA